MSDNLPTRYTLEQTKKIQVFLDELAFRTRKSKRISDSRQVNIIAEWQGFDTETVEAAIDIFLKMPTTPAQNEKYVKGIM